MAPSVEFLFATLMVDEASALDAFEWMQNIAEADGKRLVINNSWGLPQWGTPDGSALSNQFIDAMSDEGVVFVIQMEIMEMLTFTQTFQFSWRHN